LDRWVPAGWVKLSRFGGVSEPERGERESPGEILSAAKNLNAKRGK